MRQPAWFKRWRSEDGTNDHQQQPAGRRGATLLGRTRSSRRRSPLSDCHSSKDAESPTGLEGSPMSHGLF